MRRFTVFAALLAGLLLVPVASAAGPGERDPSRDTVVQLLAINDFHGHIEASTPGTIRYCCERNLDTAKDEAVTRAAGGAAYLSTWLQRLRMQNPGNSLTVGAGDLIGASPLSSGLFHDEPAVEALNQMGLEVTGVGNHEFDEGLQELYRIRFGGCHPVDGCYDPAHPYGGTLYDYLAANVFFEGSNRTIFPPVEIKTVGRAKVAFIGLTLEGTPLIVTPTAVAGLEFRPEIPVVNNLVKSLGRYLGIHTFVVLLHQGGFQNAPFSNAAQFPPGFADVNNCDNLTGDIAPIVQGLDPDVDVVVSAHTHAAYNCPNYAGTGILLTSASSFGRVVTNISLTIVNRFDQVSAKSATNVVVKQTEGPFSPASTGNKLGAAVPKDPLVDAIVQKWVTRAAPIGNRVVGSISADIIAGRDGGDNAAGESTMGDVIADAMLEATTPTDFGGAVIAFMNTGGIRGSLRVAQISGGELPGQVTYGELFTVQPFGNTLVVKTLTGDQIRRVLEQQWDNPSAGQRRIMQVSNGFTYSYNQTNPAGSRVLPGTIMVNGLAVDPLASYRVVMNNFMADGGDGYSVFKEGTNQLGGEVDIDAFARYFGAHSPVAPGPQNRITRVG
jgi:5'-nucleotidase